MCISTGCTRKLSILTEKSAELHKLLGQPLFVLIVEMEFELEQLNSC